MKLSNVIHLPPRPKPARYVPILGHVDKTGVVKLDKPLPKR